MPNQKPVPFGAADPIYFDHLVLPTLKLDQDLKITYANDAAVMLLGTSEVVGNSVFDFFARTPKLDEQFRKRRAGQGDIYEAELFRPKDGKMIPVSVTGVPILDRNDVFAGAVGIIRSLERDKIAEAIQSHLQTQRDEVKLVELVAQELNKLVPFDYFGVSLYSHDLEHVSSWIRFTSGETVEIGRRWWPLAPHLKAEMRESVAVPDFLAYLREHSLDSYLRDVAVQKFLAQGYKSFLRIPIMDRDRVVASVSLFSKEHATYSRTHIEQIKGLRIKQAIQLAIHYRNERKSQFRSDLIKDMIKLSTAKELANLLATRLAKQYDWHHVAIFRVCKADKRIRLLAESATNGGPLLSEAQRDRSSRAGILGLVFKMRRPLNIPDVSSGDFSRIFVPGWPGIRSELCLPIIWDDQVQWLLNAEDQRVQAFSSDEEQEVGVILEEAAALLQRLSRQYLLESAFKSSSDAVIITDSKRKILETNEAAAQLLGHKNPKKLRGAFKRLFKDEHIAKRLLKAERTHGLETDLVRADGTNVPVLISGVNLSDNIYRKVFVAKNLTSHRRLEHLEELKKLFQEVALQTHTPLALAKWWLEQVGRINSKDEIVDVVAKILGQLKRLEITYDRLALLSSDFGPSRPLSRRQPLDIGVEMKRTIEEFPRSDAERIDFIDPGELPYVSCDPVQVSFVFASILSYLIRFSPSEKSIHVHFICTTEIISVLISGLLPVQASASEAERNIARAQFEMALGETVIDAYARNNSARYERTQSDDGQAHFKIEFILANRESFEK
jgi:PAS domain S-box-containing protein